MSITENPIVDDDFVEDKLDSLWKLTAYPGCQYHPLKEWLIRLLREAGVEVKNP